MAENDEKTAEKSVAGNDEKTGRQTARDSEGLRKRLFI